MFSVCEEICSETYSTAWSQSGLSVRGLSVRRLSVRGLSVRGLSVRALGVWLPIQQQQQLFLVYTLDIVRQL